jgi:hypothetical protein
MPKKRENLRKCFGLNEYGLVELPKKISGRMISRLLIGDYLGCSWCFPHGSDVVNSKWSKIQRNWKEHRQAQWH